MTPAGKLVQVLQREGVRLWREGIALEELARAETPPTLEELEGLAATYTEEALAFASLLEELQLERGARVPQA